MKKRTRKDRPTRSKRTGARSVWCRMPFQRSWINATPLERSRSRDGRYAWGYESGVSLNAIFSDLKIQVIQQLLLLVGATSGKVM